MKHSLVYIMTTKPEEERPLVVDGIAICPYCKNEGIIKQELVRESNIGTNEQRWVHPMKEIKYARQYVLDGKGKPTKEVAQWGMTKSRACPTKKSTATPTPQTAE